MAVKQKTAAWIVRHRAVILVLVLLLAAGSAACIGKTRINYDLTRYLDEHTMTKRAFRVMEEEFGGSEQLRVMFADLSDEALSEKIRAMNDLPEVLAATHSPETDVARRDGKTLQLVTLTLNECDAAALVERLRAMFPEAGDYAVGGSVAAQMDVQNSVGREMPLVMGISLAVVVAVLLLTSHAWLEPLLILSVLGVSVILNLGTHFLFPDVSFITFAVSAILQLALSIDYAIMLLHTYNGFCDEGLTPEEAMTQALASCFMRIASSALTTVAGLLSLLFMSFTIGFDIGLALSKGILISMLCVFLLMPAVTLIFQKPLRRTRHRPISFGGQRLARGIWRARRPVAAALLLLVAAGAVLQTMNRYTFSEGDIVSGQGESQRISEVFGSSMPLVLLIPGGSGDEDYAAQRALAERLQAVTVDGRPAVRDIAAMVTTGAQALEYLTVDDVIALTGMEATGMNRLAVGMFFITHGLPEPVRADRLLAAAGDLAAGDETVAELQAALEQANAAFHGKRYDRMLLNLNVNPADRELTEVIDQVMAAAGEQYGEDYYLTGIPMSTYDIGKAFRSDLLKVNIITFLAILLVVSVSFRSLKLPLLLVLVIEGAIWITMGSSAAIGRPIFFVSYLICVSIQMGATIDYGILLSDQYRSLRLAGSASREALTTAMGRALPTVLTSGIILSMAGFIIGKVCSIFYISDIGLLLCRGTLISVAMVLTLLPALLALCDRWIIRAPGETGAK